MTERRMAERRMTERPDITELPRMPERRPRVLVADNAMTRLGVRMALDGLAVVCGEAADHQAAVNAALSLRPDIVLTGRSLPGGGIETVREISAAVPGTFIIFVSDADDSSDLLAALRAGAVGYVSAGFGGPQLKRAVSAVLSREAAVPRSMVIDLIDELHSAERASDDSLTGRESQILAMLRRGQSTAEIATRLRISPITVRRHISKLLQKTGSHQRSQLLEEKTL
jgi:DNA-binding NarL/FixJ family response regulator